MTIKSENKYKLLLLSKDLRSHGGVVNVVSMLLKYSPKTVEMKHFKFGPNYDENKTLISPLYSALDGLRLLMHVNRERFDSICLNSSLGVKALVRDGLYLLALYYSGHRRNTVFIHGWNTNLAYRISRSYILKNTFKRIFIKSCKIIVLASHFKEMLIHYGIPASKIDVTTTMFEEKQLKSYDHSRDKRDYYTLLFLSRLHHDKGVYQTIDAFSKIHAKYPKLKLIMAGDGPERDALIKMAKKRGLDSKISFPGYVRNKEKLEILDRSGIFVFPTFYGEGCPVSLLEAMAAGLPVITTTVGAIPDIVVNGENGFLLKDTSPDAIAAAIERFLSNTNDLRRMSQLNREKAFNKYEARIVAQSFVNIIVNLSGRSCR